MSRNITIKRIELGNEFYAETLLFDDDLSEVGRDCTDTVGESFDKGDYFGINLIEGLYKYHIFCDIYMSKIRRHWECRFWNSIIVHLMQVLFLKILNGK
ncbi:MAG: hypothetical protein IPO64_09810 [Bacteroidetes bacterium]|nr:hypothetical protein [Bacteroidota bacterium]